MAEAPPDKPAKDQGAELLRQGNKWLERIRSAEKREEDWRKDAEAAEKAYACDTSSKAEGKLYDFNILHSNVETIVPAIYNSTPVPDIRSRNTLPKVEMPEPPQMQPGQQPDPKQKLAYQQAVQQAQQLEQQTKAVKDFGAMIERAITVMIDDNKLDTEIESAAQDAFLAGRGIVRVRFHVDEDGTNERLSYEAVSWKDYRCGPAKRWQDRPWEAFRHSMPREEIERFGDAELMASQVTDTDKALINADDEDDIIVWEIWCKEPKRYVKFVRESDGKIIKEIDDPLGLSDFFSTSKPVQPISLTGRLKPVCPFTVYKKLADELDLCTRRINKIMAGLKVRGVVVGEASTLTALAQADDNELVTAKDTEGLAQTKGLDGAIMWWPIEQSIAVLKELYVQREQIKSAIYEITGISDIVRGASQASETATAQQIKTQWGSLRIQKMQRLIQRLVRDLFIISAEIITTKFSPQTLQQMTGIEINQFIQTLMNQKVLAYYRVDVESDSTVKADTTRLRTELGEFMQGTQAFFGAFAPVVQSSPEAAAPVSQIYQAIANNFNLGKQVGDALEELTQIAKTAAKQPRPNPEQEKLKAEMQMKQADHEMKAEEIKAGLQVKAAEAQIDQQGKQAELQIKREMAQLDMQIKVIDLQLKREELEMKRAERSLALQAKQAETAMGLQAKQQETSLKLDAQKQAGEIKAQQAKQQAKQKPQQAAK